MEMDVNLVKCLRSTVGMSDIDRCYNEFVLNNINTTPSIIIHHQHTSAHHHHHNINNMSSLSNQISTVTAAATPTAANPTATTSSNNRFNFNSNQNSFNQQQSMLQQPLPPYEKLHSPAIISGNLVRNNESDNAIRNIIATTTAAPPATNYRDGNNSNNNSNNLIYDNRIYCQYYEGSTSSSSSLVPTTTTTTTITAAARKPYQTSLIAAPIKTSETTTTATSSSSSSSSIIGAITSQQPTTPISKGCCIALGNRNKINKTPQEIYFESRGKSCKKLLKFNGYSNKILLYPEESWARSAASSYWTIKPSWWQPNRCKVTEITGSQRYSTKAKMLCIEKGSLLVMGSFKKKLGDSDFKLYLSSNITMEDYNMGYCLTGWVERRCSQTNAFQMTHFAVIKRQWPPSINNSNSNTAAAAANTTNSGGGGGGGAAASANATNDSKSN